MTVTAILKTTANDRPAKSVTIGLSMIVAEVDAPLVANAIESARALGVDQVVVVIDPASTEARKAAEAAGAEVYDFPWCDDFAAARNAALDHATTDWVLVLDADEVLHSSVTVETLRQLLAERPALYNITVRSEVEPGRYTVNDTSRLFPREGVRYQNTLHETPTTNRTDLESLHIDALKIEHFGYTPEAVERTNKGERNIGILAAAIFDDPANPQPRLYMAQSLHVAGYDGDAADQLRLAMWLGRIFPMVEAKSCYDQAASDLLSILGKAGKHAQAILEAKVICEWRQPEHCGFWLNLANAHLMTGMYALAASSAYRALACLGSKTQQVDEGATTWMPDAALGFAMAGLCRPGESMIHLRKALAFPDCGYRGLLQTQLDHLIALTTPADGPAA